ncbi:MAG: hypothetical protein KBS56_02755 [Clostridiales bacterium]|nr:hypothetical protein [Candidatus Crickella equi]
MSNNQKAKTSKLNILIAIIISFVAWFFVIYNYAPMKNVTYSNVPINYIGELELVQSGLGIETSTADTVDVTLKINRKNYNNISADDIYVAVDVTNAVEGRNGLSVDVTPPRDCTVERVSKDSITVEVVKGNNKDVPLTAIYGDTNDDTQEPIATAMSYSKVSVLGAADNVDKVCMALLEVNSNDLAGGEKSFVETPVAVDDDGKEVKHIIVLPGEISFNAKAAATKTVPLNVFLIRKSHNDGLSINAPEKITIKGPGSLLKNINEIDSEPVDVTDITEDTDLMIEYKLPKGVYVARKSLGNCVKVAVK